MSTIATETVDISASLGAAPGFFVLRAYDEPAFRRFTFATCGQEDDEIRVPWAALPAFEALVGANGAQMFLSAPVDLTSTPSGIALVPAMPGYMLLPAAADPLRVINLSSAGTMSTLPTIRFGNNGTHDNYGSGPVDAGAFVGSTARTTRPALADGSLVTLIDLAAPIVLDVLSAGSGSGFAWSVRFAISGAIVPAF
jgi:hypothetical protein